MSQFRFGNLPSPSQDPLSSLVTPTPRNQGRPGGTPTGPRPAAAPRPTTQPNPLQGRPGAQPFAQAPRQQPMNMPPANVRRGPVPMSQAPELTPRQPNQMQYLNPALVQGQQNIGISGQGMIPLGLPQANVGQQFINWDQALANAMGMDIANQQGAMNQQYGQMQGQIGQYEQALQQGLGTLQSVGVQQQQALQGIAGGLEQKGQQGYQEFKDFRDQQMGAVGQDITKANQFAAQATQNYQQAIADFQDTSAQDAANAAFGLRRNAQEQMAQIDMLDASPAEKAALKQTMMADVGSQVTQTVTGIYSNMNQTVASMQGNLSSLMGAQSQTAMAGGQLRGQVGTAFGAQTLDAIKMNQQMSELGANLRVMGEQALASAMQQSVMLELQGRQTVAQMIQENPRQFVSMFAGMTGFLAAATTPGIGQISVPNFGAIG